HVPFALSGANPSRCRTRLRGAAELLGSDRAHAASACGFDCPPRYPFAILVTRTSTFCPRGRSLPAGSFPFPARAWIVAIPSASSSEKGRSGRSAKRDQAPIPLFRAAAAWHPLQIFPRAARIEARVSARGQRDRAGCRLRARRSPPPIEPLRPPDSSRSSPELGRPAARHAPFPCRLRWTADPPRRSHAAAPDEAAGRRSRAFRSLAVGVGFANGQARSQLILLQNDSSSASAIDLRAMERRPTAEGFDIGAKKGSTFDFFWATLKSSPGRYVEVAPSVSSSRARAAAGAFLLADEAMSDIELANRILGMQIFPRDLLKSTMISSATFRSVPATLQEGGTAEESIRYREQLDILVSAGLQMTARLPPNPFAGTRSKIDHDSTPSRTQAIYLISARSRASLRVA
ncbi:hypothetical protein THAOC_12859, partial [Thalassiosira oceanica]